MQKAVESVKFSKPTAINKIILGDNLDIMRRLEEESIDFIYLDPPFFSNKNYEIIWGDEGEIRSFKDRWAGGIDHYITWLKERVEQMYRLLKPTGSLFLHCDWHADAYIRVFILDKIFGEKNFINQIIWHYNTGGKGKKSFLRKHDTIFFYAKSKKYVFNQDLVKIPRTAGTAHLRHGTDENGREYYEDFSPRKSGKQYRWYLDEGLTPMDVWLDIQAINPSARERIGYPTQKPEALMERIIQCASNEGDLVLDPFLGGGTTAIVADRLNRRWIGIDQSVQAVKVTDLRFQQHPEYFSEYTVQLHKYDYDKIRNDDPFDFQTWIVQQYGGIPNIRKVGDLGIDGKMPDGTPIQAKRSEDIGRNVIDNFLSAAKRSDSKLFAGNQKAGRPIGIIIAFSFGKGAIQEAARLKLSDNIILKLVPVDEIVPLAKKPAISVTVKEVSRNSTERNIEFTATANSDAGVEFYSWDFSYNEKMFKPDILRDTEGQIRYQFKPGSYRIAVKVIDNEGLEGLEVFTLTLNGKIKRTK
ncbi:MAG: site-specific DNA-methyltransferase [Planctomycetaceae bacterium]|jgi:DNA modification methylase|nr:site-specific DNA-methyltransferase [Planctomycetaceae bacterium]